MSKDWRFEPPPYGSSYPPYWGPHTEMPVDPVTQAIRESVSQEILKRFYKPEPKKDEKDEKKTLSMSKEQLMILLVLMSPVIWIGMGLVYLNTLLAISQHIK